MNPNFFPGGGFPFPPGQGIPPFFQPDWDTVQDERARRVQKLLPLLADLRLGIIPQMLSPEQLRSLVTDFKDEGNACFKEKNYTLALEMYTRALDICRQLQIYHYVTVEGEILSTLLSNRAACLLKMDMFKESVNDCELAIQQNKDNIKAYYRKAVALKYLRDYLASLESATLGKGRSLQLKHLKEVKEFEELIREVKSHLPDVSPVVSSSSDSMSSQPDAAVSRQERQSGAAELKASSDKMTRPKEGKDVKSKSSMSALDASWLEGTNAASAPKAVAVRSKKKKKKASSASQYHGRFATLQSDSEGSAASSESEQRGRGSFDTSSSVSGGISQGIATKSTDVIKENSKKRAEDMGLDDFALPAPLAYKVEQQLPSKEQSQTTTPVHTAVSEGFASKAEKPKPSETLQHLSVAGMSPSHTLTTQSYLASVKPIPTPTYVAPPPTSTVAHLGPKELLSGTLVELQTNLRLPYPFDSKYEFTLVCDKCYPQREPGHSGYIALVHLPHHCTHDVLLVRSKNDPSARWAKIRPRNTKAIFLGPYKLCRDFLVGRRCNQVVCSFAHYEEEVHLWTLDREGQFNLQQFVAEQRRNLAAGLLRPREEYERGHFIEDSSSEGYGSYHSSQHGQIPQTMVINNSSLSSYDIVRVPEIGSSELKIDPYSQTCSSFPLSPTFIYRLTCQDCLKLVSDVYWLYELVKPAGHKCGENILAVRKAVDGDGWVKIRERINHRPFAGTYMKCKHFEGGKACSHGESCVFAHSLPEQLLWTQEKDGQFSTVEFIRENRSQNASLSFDISSLLSKHPGEFGYLCRDCYYMYQRLVVRSDEDVTMCAQRLHAWEESKILVHWSAQERVTLIGPRPFTHKEAFFTLCRYQQFCERKPTNSCLFAHSLIERDVWMVERDLDISQEQLVELCTQLMILPYSEPVQPDRTALPVHTTTTELLSTHVVAKLPEPKVEPAATPPPAVVSTLTSPPPHLVEVCGLCWKNGTHSIRGTGKSSTRCSSITQGHAWDQNKMFVVLPSKRKISALPKKIPMNSNFTLCRHFQTKRKCIILDGGNCQFAHSQEEIDVWKWMVMNNVKTLDELAALYQKSLQESAAAAASASSSSRTIVRGQTVVAAKPLPRTPFPNMAVNVHYCHYCSIHCNSQKQWDEHCASERHMFNVNSDKEHQWNYRQPPWGISGDSYELCKPHEDGGKCKFSGVPDVYNQCKFAHSQEELDEWKERWEWRQMKRDMAKKEHLYSYMDELREDYENADCGMGIIAEQLEGVKISCSSKLRVCEEKKNTKLSWIFDVQLNKGKMLNKVALLYDQDRLHFSLRADGLDRDCQIAQGEAFFCCTGVYKVEVVFVGGIFGSFSQWVIFDFNQRPVVAKKLNVELGTTLVQDQVKTLRKKLDFDRWTSDNHEIVPFNTNREIIEYDLNTFLLHHYRTPSSVDAVVTQQSVGVELNRHNYMHKMHKLLYIEELTQAQIMARYNLKISVKLTNVIQEEYGGFVSARPDELFARVSLNEQLNEDTDAGSLILSSSTCVLLALQNTSSRKVYEAIFVQKENFDYNGRGREYVYLCLSSGCCRDLDLAAGDEVEVEIQFQMNRLPFCQMHYAVDLLPCTDIVFPDVTKINNSFSEKPTLRISSSVLNEDQMKVMEYIVSERHGYTPPLVIYGPFGTGKTETLAQAAMIVSMQKMGARILICTHSNSAADVYISRHFDAFLSNSGRSVRVLRVVATDRRLNTISPVVRRYCLMSPDQSRILAPTKEDILAHDVVITTLVTSLLLTKLEVKGCFTHIFIDEAAQVFESEAIMPLSLADEATGVVLAGDYYQMAQKVYSAEAKRQRFHCSLVERLFHYYKTHTPVVGSNLPNVLLSSNYRTKMEIVRFIAAVFYGGPDVLHSFADHPDVSGIVPLTFYTAQGCEVQDSDSTSFYNMAEVEEVVERVSDLVQHWPEEWNEPYINAAESILVVTPYFDQVQKIRSALRKKGKELRLELSRVSVERVSAIQGSEFRAVFLSTVRTRHLVEECPRMTSKVALECDGEVRDFGFLSDPKLLNTALTRARSFVAIVGDPIVLCAIGECTNIWRTFLKHCQNMGSIHPPTMTLESVRTQVQTLMNSQYSSNIQMLTKINQEDAAEMDRVTEAQNSGEKLESEFSGLTIEPNPFESVTVNGVFEDWNLDYHIEPDSILEQVAMEAQKTAKREKEKAKGGIPSKHNVGRSEDPLKVSCVHLHKGHAVLHYGNEPPGKKSALAASRKRSLLTGDDVDNTYDSDEDLSETDDNEIEPTSALYVDYHPQQLQDLLDRQPDRFKHAILVIETSSNMYAKCIDDPLKLIKISSRMRCGRAFSNDEVVVEVLPIDPDDLNAISDVERSVVQGQVIGILRRNINPKYRMFVCMVEEDNTGLMVPINRNIPKIYNLETKDKLKKTKKGHVCVYTFTRSREIVFHHYEPVDVDNPTSKLFIVRYLKWDSKCYAPLGIVVGVLPTGVTTELAMNILNVENYVPERFKADTMAEIERLYPISYSIPANELVSRADFRRHLTFTVDPELSTDLDDAISLEELPNKCYVIGVHIADVSFFVPRNSFTDQEAAARGTTLYPFGRTQIPMLPERLSSDLCSLLPGVDRLTLSILLTINSQAEVQNVQVKRSVIRSQFRLTYMEVEQVLRGNFEYSQPPLPDELQLIIMMLSRVAQIWRRQRLGTGALCGDTPTDDARDAHVMIEEVMIMTNHHAALMLIERIPQSVPLRTHLPPEESDVDEWKGRFTTDAKNTVALTHVFKKRGEVCSCFGECSCFPDSDVDHLFDIDKSIWESIREAAINGNYERLQMLVLDAQNHPQVARAMYHWQNIQQRSSYVCSGELRKEIDQHHSSLNISLYSSFTSPIRRYIDLVVARLLIDSVVEGRQSTYSKSDIADICCRGNEVISMARKYESMTRLVHCAQYLRQWPTPVHAVVDRVTDTDVELLFSTVKSLLPQKTRLTTAALNVGDKPLLTESGELILKWAKRLYTLNPQRLKLPNIELGLLNSDKYIYQTHSSVWRQLVEAVASGSHDEIVNQVISVSGCLSDPSADDKYLTDVTSEGAPVNSGKQFCEFSFSLRNSSIVQVQMSADMFKGLPSPRLQLFSLTPTLDVCVEHKLYPVQCFAGLTSRNAARQNYADVVSYQSDWLPVLAMEASYQAVNGRSPNQLLIHDVAIQWTEREVGGCPEYLGLIELPVQFCRQRAIFFNISDDDNGDDEDNDDITQKEKDESVEVGVKSTCYGYMCVRYGGNIMDRQSTEPQLEALERFSSSSVWVAHCVVTKIIKSQKRDLYALHIRINRTTSVIPQEILNPGSAVATIEWIPKGLPDRRAENAVCQLEHASPLAKAIALGRHHNVALEEDYLKMVDTCRSYKIPGIPPPNAVQAESIEKALRQPFTLIQGPPGTGKSACGAWLACLYSHINGMISDSTQEIKKQVMICGPSNKSVDVIAKYLKQLKSSCPPIVRVYSAHIEQASFPLPSYCMLSLDADTNTPSDDDLKAVSLHHMVHSGIGSDRLDGQLIQIMDERIRHGDTSMTSEELNEYRNAIKRSEFQILRKADIILCTCSASCLAKIQQATVIKQLIIDECGMCTEPETLIPIVHSQAEQIVLIGDHMQLQPIVTEKTAQKRGLIRSLFERYADKAIMLTTQYRMHEAIAAFPSVHFYNNQLNIGKEEQLKTSALKFWPNDRKKPIAFVHVMGCELSLPVSTADGHELSKYNIIEVEAVVRAVTLLTRRFHVLPTEVAVLTQYRAQCSQIELELQKRGENGVSVSTVIAAQGSEWEYVLLSTVRSLPKCYVEKRPTKGWKYRHLGFIADTHQINVALTRAKKGLIIIGNKYLLECDETWKKLLNHYSDLKKIVNVSDFMQ